MDVWYNGDYSITFYEYRDENNPFGRRLGHTWKDWNMIPKSRPFVTPPSKKTATIELKAANGKIDVSDNLTGYPLYNNREGSWSFYIADYGTHEAIKDNLDYDVSDNVNDPILATILEDFPIHYSAILNAIHGRKVAIVLDEDPEYYYKGIVTVEQWESSNDNTLNGVTINYDVFPYKISKTKTEIELVSGGNLNANVWSAEQTFQCGSMPNIPYLNIKTSDRSSANIDIRFTKEDGTINYKKIFSNDKLTKLIGFFDSEHNLENPTILLANSIWSNADYAIEIKSDKSLSSAKLIFRKGEL